MARKLKGLEDVISVAIVEPAMTREGWRFGDYPGANHDEVNGATYLHEIYTRADPNFSGRATIPVLWDCERETIVNNESADIVRMFNSGFGALAKGDIDLYPAALRDEIDALNDAVYPKLNNGVYRAGFATTQAAYDEAFHDVFAMLDELEARLQRGPFLFGDALTETDIRVFVTLIRFDAAYHGQFKCNRRPDRRLPRPLRLPQAYAKSSRRPGDGQHRPHQARLLFDQDAEPARHRPAGAGSRRTWIVTAASPQTYSAAIFRHAPARWARPSQKCS